MHANDTSLKMVAGRPDQFPKDAKPQIALSGRSNVGKSSLINRLIGVKSLARTSSVPGKTVTVNFYECESRFYLVDLPGYGYVQNQERKSAFSSVADAYFQQNDRLKLVLQLIDAKVGATNDDLTMLDFLHKTGILFAVVATKCDKLSASAAERAASEIREKANLEERIPVILFSAKSGRGKEELKGLIFSCLKSSV